MKTILLTIFAAFILMSADQAEPKEKFVYCHVTVTYKIRGVSIALDTGQDRSFAQDMRLRDDATGKIEKFESVIDALNYMGQDGWELIVRDPVSAGATTMDRYLLKKKVAK